MESKSIFTCLVLLMVLYLLLTREPYDYSSVYGCLSANSAGVEEINNRKVLAALKGKKTAFKARLQGSTSGNFGEKSLTFESRKVPSGPDPLHHHGGTPKKPRTP